MREGIKKKSIIFFQSRENIETNELPNNNLISRYPNFIFFFKSLDQFPIPPIIVNAPIDYTTSQLNVNYIYR